jgi:hexosaminidase
MDNFGKVQYMIFPRIAALSEMLWTEKANKNWDAFEKRLPVFFKRYESMGVQISNAYYDIKPLVSETPNNTGVLLSLSTKAPNGWLVYNINQIDTIETYKKPILIDRTQTIYANFTDTITHEGKSNLQLDFNVNKATGKKISLATPPSKSYPGDGAFTLVNGIQNTKGTAKSKEFLGFSGTDCEATIDLGTTQPINNVVIHYLQQKSSWIWAPKSIEIYTSDDGNNFKLASTDHSITPNGEGNNKVNLSLKSTTRYLKIIAANNGTIAEGSPGAGNKAWLFIDEIEAK